MYAEFAFSLSLAQINFGLIGLEIWVLSEVSFKDMCVCSSRWFLGLMAS